MEHFTTVTYQMKREIFQFGKRLSKTTTKEWEKLTADMLFGILASGSCVLSQMADVLHEGIKKKNTVERLGRKLLEKQPEQIRQNFLRCVQHNIDVKGAIYVDDTEVVKPYGRKFEALGLVRDASKPNPIIEKGYHVTEITGLTLGSKQPVSLYSHIHSSKEKNYLSINDVTYQALEEAFSVAPQATYVFDRGYDMNDLFTFMYQHNKRFVVRLTEKRKLFFKGKWYRAPLLRASHKGKIKTNVMFQGCKHNCYISCLNVRITQGRKPLRLILVYGLGETPMMLATNHSIQSKEDAIRVVRMYFSRWRIEEYFRFKKQHFRFENFRVRSLRAMNALNQFLGYAIAFLALLTQKQDSSVLKTSVLCSANPQREHVSFLMYRFGCGVLRILARARTGIREWFHIGRPKFMQLEFCL